MKCTHQSHLRAPSSFNFTGARIFLSSTQFVLPHKLRNLIFLSKKFTSFTVYTIRFLQCFFFLLQHQWCSARWFSMWIIIWNCGEKKISSFLRRFFIFILPGSDWILNFIFLFFDILLSYTTDSQQGGKISLGKWIYFHLSVANTKERKDKVFHKSK